MTFDFASFLTTRSNKRVYSDNDACRMAAYFVQDGRCYVTDRPLLLGDRELHHRLPRVKGGLDRPENLILLGRKVHRLVHTDNINEAEQLLQELCLTPKQLAAVNQLRVETLMAGFLLPAATGEHQNDMARLA